MSRYTCCDVEYMMLTAFGDIEEHEIAVHEHGCKGEQKMTRRCDRWEIEKVGENYKLSFPRSENWSCDGEWFTPEEICSLVADLREELDY